jgi:hypothetical protein
MGPARDKQEDKLMQTLPRLIATAATLVVLAAPALPALADVSSDSAAVWHRHVERAVAGDIDAVMEDFAEDSVIITSQGVLEGKAAIRQFFEAFLGDYDQAAIDSTVVNTETIHGDVVVFNFTVGSAGMTYQDTAVIGDDRIRVLTTVGYPTPQ